MSSSGGSFSSASLNAGSDWHVHCHAYPGAGPILAICAGDGEVTITIAGREQVSAHAVSFARELACQAARFAAECERLHAGHQDTASAEGSKPAADAA